MVSGLATRATFTSAFLPRLWPISANVDRSSSASRSGESQPNWRMRPENSVLGGKIVDLKQPFLIDLSRHRREPPFCQKRHSHLSHTGSQALPASLLCAKSRSEENRHTVRIIPAFLCCSACRFSVSLRAVTELRAAHLLDDRRVSTGST